jgi:hypothetical protein
MQPRLQPRAIIAAFFMLFSLLANSCGSNEETRYTPDISATPKSKTTLIRFEALIAGIDSANVATKLPTLMASQPKFSSLFLGSIIAPDRSGDPAISLASFLSFPDTRPLLDTIAAVYKDLSKEQTEIEQLLRYRSFYFPKEEQKYDTIYTFASLYNYGYGVFENYIVIGLDYFLGENHRFYAVVPNLAPQYVRRTLTRPHLVRGVALALATDLVERHSRRIGNKMIDYMLYEGKKLYLAQAFLPKTPDSIIFAFSAAQMEHCIRGERSLYDYLLKEQLFYSDKYDNFRKYIEIGPFNPANALYGNSGSWLGAQMVAQYVTQERKAKKLNEPQIIEKMLKETDAQAFFKRYKPKQ